jgi:DNA-binding CsgD family transcriptional regulator
MTVGGKLREFGDAIGGAEGFVEIAKRVCVEVKRLYDLDACTVTLHGPSERPALTVDQQADVTDEQRLGWFSPAAWGADPLHAAMLERRAPVRGPVSPADACTWLLPIIEPAGVLGSIRCDQDLRGSPAGERELLMLGTIVSVRLAHLGVTALRAPAPRAALTPRQREVAELAGRGFTNREIGEHLGLSLNTVKNRLKDVFERLAVMRRVELVHALAARAPHLDVRPGVTRDGGFTIALAARA